MTVVYMPPAVMMGGHVRGFRITSGTPRSTSPSAGARCAVWSGLTGASPIASGWSRMQPAATAANTRVTPPITTNVSRHPTASTRIDLPAPVSPVRTLRPAPNSTSAVSMTASRFILRNRSMESERTPILT